MINWEKEVKILAGKVVNISTVHPSLRRSVMRSIRIQLLRLVNQAR